MIGVVRNIRRRSAVGWAGLICAGVALAVVVAWQPWRPSHPSVEFRDSTGFSVAAGGRLFRLHPSEPAALWSAAFIWVIEPGEEAIHEGLGVARGSAPAWLPKTPLVHPERYRLQEAYRISASGWPMRCVYSVLGEPVNAGRGTLATRRALGVAFDWPFGYQRSFPYGILWRGLIIDALVFTAIALAAAESFAAARRVWRRRRGVCVWCGYPLRGLGVESEGCTVCPECGAAWRVGAAGGEG